VQPAGLVTGVAWASPVELVRAGQGVWRGTVTPMEESTTLYAEARRDTDGKIRMVFRNPDGFFGNAKFVVAAEGDHVKLQSLQNGATLLEGDYDAKRDRLLLPVPDGTPFPELHTTLELTRLSRETAVGYYPRTPAEPKWTYRPPLALGDGWRTADLAAAGMEEARVGALLRLLLDTDPWPQTAPLVHSLLVARHGKLVLEEYFYGYDASRPHEMRSAGKTLASILAGVAIQGGAKLAPGTPVYASFPEYASFANPDPRKKAMTLEHLMTMTSGLACDENDDGSPGNEMRMQTQTAQPDWFKFALDLPMAAAPGDKAAYCSAGVNLAGAMVRNASRTWLPELFERRLARPLGFGMWHMNLTPTGEGYMGGGIHLRPRDALKLGQVYLDGGVWGGKRIVSRSWVETSTRSHPMSSKGTDGYDWHVMDVRAGDRVYKEYEANGNGGQFVIVVPEADIVVVFTAGNFMNYGVWRRFRDEYLPQYILASIRDR
jgi:CubicO group peptidase (beta-lactamase class C family)